MVVRIIGIGRRTGGDDGAGPAVIDHLRRQTLAATIELHEIGEPSALIPLLEQATRVIVVDAALDAGPPGTIHIVRPEDIDKDPHISLSTHGMSVGQAIGLARVLAPETICADIAIVAIAAQKPEGVVMRLSADVAAAIEPAAETVRRLAERTLEE